MLKVDQSKRSKAHYTEIFFTVKTTLIAKVLGILTYRNKGIYSDCLWLHYYYLCSRIDQSDNFVLLHDKLWQTTQQTDQQVTRVHLQDSALCLKQAGELKGHHGSQSILGPPWKNTSKNPQKTPTSKEALPASWGRWLISSTPTLFRRHPDYYVQLWGSTT